MAQKNNKSSSTKNKNSKKIVNSDKTSGASSKKNISSKKVDNKKTVSATKVKKTNNSSTLKSKNDPKKNLVEKKTTKKNKVEKNKNDENSFTDSQWKAIAIVAGLVFLILLIVIVLLTSTASKDNYGKDNYGKDNYGKDGVGENQSNQSNGGISNLENLKLIVVEDSNCTNCNVDEFVSQVQDNLFPQMQVEAVSSTSQRGKDIIEKLDLLILPVYLFSSEIENDEEWVSMASVFNLVQLEEENYYLLNQQVQPPGKVLISDIPIPENTIVIGNPNASVTLYEFSDYECPYCAIAEGNEELVAQFSTSVPNYQPPIPKILDEYVEKGLVRYVFYNLPIASLHPEARIAHLAALCANDQGSWEEFHKKLFADRSDWISSSNKSETFISYAVEFGLDEEEFEMCLRNEVHAAQIEEESQIANSLGVSGTPAFFVNKFFIEGAQDYLIFQEYIEEELSK
jgi:protein-disulfide isomerase